MESILESPCVETPDSLPQKKGNTKPQYSNMYAEAKEIQAIVLEELRKKDVKALVKAQLSRAYKDMAELRLRLQGKGPPKAVDYGSRTKKPKPAKGFTETAQDVQKPVQKPPETVGKMD